MAMNKRGNKLQILTQTSDITCLSIGRKSCKLIISGGDDDKAYLWSIGSPNFLLNLSGHTSSVESVALDSFETLALSGCSSGTTTLWDLQEAKVLSSISGHSSSCISVEFHPFGDFFASGSADNSLKIWDIRTRGCIHNFGGHVGGVNAIKFSPDGRWVVSGGEKGIVKLWDLTAGKLLHNFMLREGKVQSIDFHPLEFLLAIGSTDQTVKFWDLETFELIDSAGPELSEIYCIMFHPDGKNLFCGLKECLKVLSWEPVRYHDAVHMGWSTLADLSLHNDELFGCSYKKSQIDVWVADISIIDPYAKCLPKCMNLNDGLMDRQKAVTPGSRGMQQMPISVAGCRDGQSDLPTAGKACALKDVHVFATPIHGSNLSRFKKSSTLDFCKGNMLSRNANETSLMLPGHNLFKQETPPDHERKNVFPVKLAHCISGSKLQLNSSYLTFLKEENSLEGCINYSQSCENTIMGPKFNPKSEALKDTGKNSTGGSVADVVNKMLCSDLTDCSSFAPSDRVKPVKYVKGVAIQQGRTRSLVEKWERQEINNRSRSEAVSEKEKLSQLLDFDVIDSLIRTHPEFIDILKSRVTKMKVVRHLWRQKGIKSSIDVLKRLPDHAVQADVVAILLVKSDLVTLELFASLLPLLSGLLDSKVERFQLICLEMLQKLVTTFGPTLSSSPTLGVDVHADRRRECCKKCFIQLQQIKQNLHSLMRRESLEKLSMQLNISLEEIFG